MYSKAGHENTNLSTHDGAWDSGISRTYDHNAFNTFLSLPNYMLFQPYQYANAHPSRSNAESTGSTPHIAKQVILSSTKVLLWSGGRCSSSSDRTGVTPAAEVLLLLRSRSGSGRWQRTGMAPASKVVVILNRLRCLRWLGFGLRLSRRGRGRGRWVRLRPCVVVAPRVAVST